MGELGSIFEAARKPRRESRPITWWHWMNGNVNLAGIRKDLHWMHSIGLGGVQLFEGGLGAPQSVPSKLEYGSESWRQAVSFARREARELGLEFGIATSAGWSALGAPWVKPENAMKKVVWSLTELAADSSVTTLQPLPGVSGPYQDCSNWNSPIDQNFVRDTFVLAFPAPGYLAPLVPKKIESNRDFSGSTNLLTDRSFSEGIVFSKDPDEVEHFSIDYDFGTTVSVASSSVGLPGPKGFGAPYSPRASIWCSRDGVEYKKIVDLPREEYLGQAGECPARTASFEPVVARFFRLLIETSPLAEAQPKIQPGVKPLPIRPAGVDQLTVSEFGLFTGGRVHWAEHKAGFSIAKDYFAAHLVGPESTEAIDSADILDLTEYLGLDGSLPWKPPPGNWAVLRFGYSLTGHRNGPAPDGASGLEIDKLSPAAVGDYLATYLSTFGPDFLPDNLINDSIESGAQNWTDLMPGEFKKRRGYSITNVLPAIAGLVVDSVEKTDRMLADFRLTITELLSEATYATVNEFCAARGMTHYAEALEDKRPQLGDDLAIRSKVDVPMGAMWMYDSQGGPEYTYIADLLGAASVAHVYGKPRIGCESFTAYGRPFMALPAQLKPVADLELALGVNRFNIHTSPHQPDGVSAPGITMAPTLGQAFSRNETWAQLAQPWINYLTTCCELLSSLKPASRVLYFIGEDAPVTGIWGESEVDVPDGFPVDFISLDGLLNKVSVSAGGKLVASDSSYDLLFLGGSSARASILYLRRLAQLVSLGAMVVGNAPSHPLGLLDDSEEWYRLRDQLFGQNSSPLVEPARTLKEFVASQTESAELKPSWRFENEQGIELTAGVGRFSQLRCIQRTSDNMDLFFVANSAAQSITLTATFGVDAVSAFKMSPAEASQFRQLELDSDQPGMSKVEVTLRGYESVFLLFSKEATPAPLAETDERDAVLSIERSTWQTVSPTPSPFDYSPLVLRTEVELNPGLATGAEFFIELNDFYGLAEVLIDDKPAGVIWAPNQRLNLGVAPMGTCRIDLHIVPTWRNRLIGMARGEAFSSENYIAWNPYEASAEPADYDFSAALISIRSGK